MRVGDLFCGCEPGLEDLWPLLYDHAAPVLGYDVAFSGDYHQGRDPSHLNIGRFKYSNAIKLHGEYDFTSRTCFEGGGAVSVLVKN